MATPDDKATRRTVLRQLTGSAAVTGLLPVLGQNPPPENHHSSQPVTRRAAAYKYRFFSPDQLEMLDALGETIIPTDDHSPGAKAARVSEYIDAIVSDAPETTKQLWNEGLATVDRMAREKFQRAYPSCSPAQQTEILTVLAGEEDPSTRREGDFFFALKRATVDGYYTSSVGIFEDLQYQGNAALPAFPGCRHGEGGSEHS